MSFVRKRINTDHTKSVYVSEQQQQPYSVTNQNYLNMKNKKGINKTTKSLNKHQSLHNNNNDSKIYPQSRDHTPKMNLVFKREKQQLTQQQKLYNPNATFNQQQSFYQDGLGNNNNQQQKMLNRQSYNNIYSQNMNFNQSGQLKQQEKIHSQKGRNQRMYTDQGGSESKQFQRNIQQQRSQSTKNTQKQIILRKKNSSSLNNRNLSQNQQNNRMELLNQLNKQSSMETAKQLDSFNISLQKEQGNNGKKFINKNFQQHQQQQQSYMQSYQPEVSYQPVVNKIKPKVNSRKHSDAVGRKYDSVSPSQYQIHSPYNIDLHTPNQQQQQHKSFASQQRCQTDYSNEKENKNGMIVYSQQKPQKQSDKHIVLTNNYFQQNFQPQQQQQNKMYQQQQQNSNNKMNIKVFNPNKTQVNNNHHFSNQFKNYTVKNSSKNSRDTSPLVKFGAQRNFMSNQKIMPTEKQIPGNQFNQSVMESKKLQQQYDLQQNQHYQQQQQQQKQQQQKQQQQSHAKNQYINNIRRGSSRNSKAQSQLSHYSSCNDGYNQLNLSQNNANYKSNYVENSSQIYNSTNSKSNKNSRQGRQTAKNRGQSMNNINNSNNNNKTQYKGQDLQQQQQQQQQQQTFQQKMYRDKTVEQKTTQQNNENQKNYMLQQQKLMQKMKKPLQQQSESSQNQQQQPSSSSQQRQQQVLSRIQNQQKIENPKEKYEMSDEEWRKFGDRKPQNHDKLKLLGRGGFAMVWLGLNKKTQEKYAMKQILSENQHQTHLKEIWFGRQFFDQGQPKEKFLHYQGWKNLSKMIGFDIQSKDTWIYYELCGQSLGSSLYDLKGEGKIGNERIYKIHYKSLYKSFVNDQVHIKKLMYDIGSALLLLSDQNIVHSDVKTENILLQQQKDKQFHDAKLIDYGSSFTFGNLKHFSMATPEYMAPEILNFILYQNNMNYFDDMLEFLDDYEKPYVIDIWSLGCVILELISGLPLWMSLNTLVKHNGKEFVKTGLFAAKGRVFDQIIQKQVEVVQELDYVLDNMNFSGIKPDQQLRSLLKQMLELNPYDRISPLQLVNELAQTLGLPLHQINNSSSNSSNNNNTQNREENNKSGVTKGLTVITQSTTEQF